MSEIGWQVRAPQQISTGFASWLHYFHDLINSIQQRAPVHSAHILVAASNSSELCFFLGEPGSAGSASGPPPPVPEENLWRLMEWGFLQAGCPSCHPTSSVKALKGAQST